MKHLSVKLDTPCELINVTPVNPLISKCQIKVCYVGDEPNRNRSVITKDVAREMANSLPGSPIVGYFNEDKGDFEEHNRIIDISNGKFQIKDTTRPYGFVDLGAKCWFQEFDDEGVVHEYLMTEGWLWTGQYPEAKRIIENGNNQSMELDENLIDAHWTKDDNGKPQFFIINEAIISKLCILGEDCEPCFEGSQITKVQFSFESSFEEKLFSMMKEVKEILNEGGAPVFTTYAVEIGDSLWTALYDYLVNHYADEECEFCSVYRVEGIYEEEGQKFAILQHRTTMDYFRMNFSISEEGFSASEELIAVEKEFVPAAEPQFALDAYENYVSEYAASKKTEEPEKEEKEVCEKCGKPLDECECEDEDKKDKYVLEEIPEYMELSQSYSALKADYETLNEQVATLNATKAELEEQVSSLTAFKLGIERKEKEKMINETFYMVSDEDKEEVLNNIDTYSLDDIEAKLATICFRNKLSFSQEEETPAAGTTTYNLDGIEQVDNAVPAWVKAVLDKQKNM